MALSNRTIALIASAGVAGMVGLAYAAVPLYDMFCKVTGFGGTTRVATQGPSQILDQTVEVRFDANVADAPLQFRALQTRQTVQLGQHGLAFYEVKNPTNQEVRVIAAYNVTPHYAGPYFNKLECFCFSERVIAPGETRKLPVVYFVAPELVTDRVAGKLETITLSYTFFDSSAYSGPRDQPVARKAAEGAANSASPG
ncbi:MAG TPA: cytochrome c oxidase assembly protein [Hyphomonas sp.]|nr:cytochrome c oxidase assembly protein [Hyphomonas sp.]HRI99904.1 cytochrome c oxidase assembly protein [Hyphomonas sp.]HRK66250.1 cytochrome c oxidase assembly protein [Hyphomonas sp.]